MMMITIARHHESPIEVERRRRQLGPAPVIRSTLEQLQPRQRRHTAGEAKQLQQRREQLEETAGGEEQLRDRRQTSDPDQLCPTLASFVMPRAAVNSAGDWMFIVNMNDQPEFQQLVRSEVCM